MKAGIPDLSKKKLIRLKLSAKFINQRIILSIMTYQPSEQKKPTHNALNLSKSCTQWTNLDAVLYEIF